MTPLEQAIEGIKGDIDACKKAHCPNLLKKYETALAALNTLQEMSENPDHVYSNKCWLAKFQEYLNDHK